MAQGGVTFPLSRIIQGIDAATSEYKSPGILGTLNAAFNPKESARVLGVERLNAAWEQPSVQNALVGAKDALANKDTDAMMAALGEAERGLALADVDTKTAGLLVGHYSKWLTEELDRQKQLAERLFADPGRFEYLPPNQQAGQQAPVLPPGEAQIAPTGPEQIQPPQQRGQGIIQEEGLDERETTEELRQVYNSPQSQQFIQQINQSIDARDSQRAKVLVSQFTDYLVDSGLSDDEVHILTEPLFFKQTMLDPENEPIIRSLSEGGGGAITGGQGGQAQATQMAANGGAPIEPPGATISARGSTFRPYQTNTLSDLYPGAPGNIGGSPVTPSQVYQGYRATQPGNYGEGLFADRMAGRMGPPMTNEDILKKSGGLVPTSDERITSMLMSGDPEKEAFAQKWFEVQQLSRNSTIEDRVLLAEIKQLVGTYETEIKTLYKGISPYRHAIGPDGRVDPELFKDVRPDTRNEEAQIYYRDLTNGIAKLEADVARTRDLHRMIGDTYGLMRGRPLSSPVQVAPQGVLPPPSGASTQPAVDPGMEAAAKQQFLNQLDPQRLEQIAQEYRVSVEDLKEALWQQKGKAALATGSGVSAQ